MWEDITHPDAYIKTNRYGYKYDALAGFRRNEEMAKYADALICIYNGNSPGSTDMLKRAKKHNLKVYKYIVNENK